MLYSPSYQMYKYEHGLYITAAEQRATDIRAGEIAAALRDLRLGLGRAFRLGRRRPPTLEVADAVAAPVRFLSSAR